MTTPTMDVPTTQPPVQPAAVVALAPGYSDAAAAAAVTWALAQVEDYCEREFALSTDTVAVTAHGGEALLPSPPVVDVTAVQALVRWPRSAATLSWQDLDGYAFNTDGAIWDGRACAAAGVPWPTIAGGLKVTYTHGFENWPRAVVAAVTALAVAYINNPAGMSERRVLDTTYRWAPGLGAAGVADPFAGLARYKLREVA